MRYIAITREAFLPAEAEAVALLLDGGFARVHLRKSAATEEQMRAFIERLPGRLYDRLTLHDRHELAAEYGLGGVHLNGRNPQPPADFRGTVSRSCHSLEELRNRYSDRIFSRITSHYELCKLTGPDIRMYKKRLLNRK